MRVIVVVEALSWKLIANYHRCAANEGPLGTIWPRLPLAGVRTQLWRPDELAAETVTWI